MPVLRDIHATSYAPNQNPRPVQRHRFARSGWSHCAVTWSSPARTSRGGAVLRRGWRKGLIDAPRSSALPPSSWRADQQNRGVEYPAADYKRRGELFHGLFTWRTASRNEATSAATRCMFPAGRVETDLELDGFLFRISTSAERRAQTSDRCAADSMHEGASGTKLDR